MTTFSVAFDGTRVNAAETTTGWTNGGQEPDILYQGTYSMSTQIKTTREVIYYTTTSRNMESPPEIWLAKVVATTKDALDIGGLEVGFYDGTAYGMKLQARSAVSYPPEGGWQIIAFDPNQADFIDFYSTGTSISPSGITRFAAAFEYSASPKSENSAVDAVDVIDVGTGLTGTGGTTTPGKFSDFINFDEGTQANRYGIVQTRGGILYVSAVLTIGASGTATEFTDANQVLVFPYQFVGAGSVGTLFDIQNASTDISATGCLFNGRGEYGYVIDADNRPDHTILGTSGVLDVSSSSFDTYRNVTLNSKVTAQDCTFNAGLQITPAGADMRGSTVRNFNRIYEDVSIETSYGAINSAQTTYTFTAQAVGTAASDRIVVVGFGGEEQTTRTLTSVTIGGNTATVHQYEHAGGTFSFAGIASYNLTTGTTANIVLTFSGACDRCYIQVWSLYGCDSTVATSDKDSDSAGGNDISISLGANAGGVDLVVYTNEQSGYPAQFSSIQKFDHWGPGENGQMVMIAGSSSYGKAGSKTYLADPNANGNTLVGASFNSATPTTDAAALIWDVATSTSGLLDNMTFVKGDELGHAIEFDATTSPTTVYLTGITFTGYNGTDGQLDSAVHFKRTSGTITVYTSGSTGFSYKSAGATINEVATSYSTTVTVRSSTGAAIQSANVFVKASDGTGPMPFEETVTIVNSGTTATVDHTGHGMSTNDKVLIVGASLAANNGCYQITVSDVDTYTYTMGSTPGSSPTGTIKATYVAIYGGIDGLTDVNGEVDISRAWGSSQPVVGWARKSSTAPYYKSAPIAGTISSTADTSLSATMVLDQ